MMSVYAIDRGFMRRAIDVAEELDWHHVPPKHPDKYFKFGGRRKSKKAEYDMLFGYAPNFDAACKILLEDWWRPNGKVRFQKKRAGYTLRKPMTDHRAYHIIFGNPRSFEAAQQILWINWWSPDTGELFREARNKQHLALDLVVDTAAQDKLGLVPVMSRAV